LYGIRSKLGFYLTYCHWSDRSSKNGKSNFHKLLKYNVNFSIICQIIYTNNRSLEQFRKSSLYFQN
jgi:hypothetical protein